MDTKILFVKNYISFMSPTERQVKLRELLESFPDSWLQECHDILLTVQATRGGPQRVGTFVQVESGYLSQKER